MHNYFWELWQSNGIGSRYYTPRLIETGNCDRQDALRLLRTTTVNGYYYLVYTQAGDRVRLSNLEETP